MKKPCLILVCLIFLASSYGYATDLTLNNTPAKLFFSPQGGTTKAIVKEIDNATMEILVQAYSFTSTPIAKVLVDATKRGVRVEAILDKSQARERLPLPPISPTTVC